MAGRSCIGGERQHCKGRPRARVIGSPRVMYTYKEQAAYDRQAACTMGNGNELGYAVSMLQPDCNNMLKSTISSDTGANTGCKSPSKHLSTL